MKNTTETTGIKIDEEVLTRSKNLPFVRFLLYTGLRLGDAATARTDQIDWQEKTLTRTMAKTSRPVTFPLHPDLFKPLSSAFCKKSIFFSLFLNFFYFPLKKAQKSRIAYRQPGLASS